MKKRTPSKPIDLSKEICGNFWFRVTGRPSFRDLEGSSQIEKDASLIWLLDRDENDPRLVTLRLEKGRNTGTGELQGRFNGTTLNFEF